METNAQSVDNKAVVYVKLFVFACVACMLLISCENSPKINMGYKYFGLTDELIYSDGKHNAFTDVCIYKGKYYLCFRNSERHCPLNKNEYGKIYIMQSLDGDNWKLLYIVRDVDSDLRDPKFVVTSDNKLMIYCGFSNLIDGKLTFQGSKAGFINSDTEIPTIKTIYIGKWLWRIIWKGDFAYSFAYSENDEIFLLKSRDGVHWTEIVDFNMHGYNECSPYFLGNQMRVIVRTTHNYTLAGYSDYPYTKWAFTVISTVIQCPNVLVTSKNEVLLTGRYIDDENKSNLGFFRLSKFNDVDTIWISKPTEDIGYPGVIQVNSQVWLSYYIGNTNEGEIHIKKFSIEKQN